MKYTKNGYKLSPIVIALSLAACGGSSSNNDIAGIDGSGSPANASGPVTGFGSILVNGRRYIVENDTIITLDGESILQTNLQIGQFVTILSTSVDEDGNPIADLVRSDTLIEGPIEQIDVANQTITVLNQQIKVSEKTVFDDDLLDQSIHGLNINDVIEVTGSQNNTGMVLATRIELDDENDDFKLVGPVSGLDEANQQFTVNGLTVSYFGATLEDIPGGTLSDGDVVQVEGSLNSGVLESVEVEGFDDVFDSLDEDASLEIKGPVTRFVSLDDFDVNGISVLINDETEYEGGSVSDLALDVVVEVEGYWDNGSLVAEEVSFEREDNLAVSGVIETISAVDATSNEGSLTVLGIEALTNSSSFFEDSSAAEIFDFGFDDLSLGDYVEIEGYLSENGQFIVTELEREELSDEAEIEGLLEAKSLPDSITLLGVVIDTSAIDTSDLTDVALGTEVSVSGMIVQGSFVVSEVSVESDGD